MSNSKSKTPRTSKNTRSKSAPVAPIEIANGLAIGHSPVATLKPQDEALFRAFQSNLLSLISHELRTPLMGILNSLNLLSEGSLPDGFTSDELVTMARQNAQRLHRTLVMLLDLASIESGTFHARLKEVEFSKIARGKIEACKGQFKDREIELRISDADSNEGAVLGDVQKLGRAVELVLQVLATRAKSAAPINIRISSTRAEFGFQLQEGMEAAWEDGWTQALVGYEGGVASPSSAFAGVMQSEQAFLSRSEEGLGSEFLLIHEILRRHGGKLTQSRSAGEILLSIELPSLQSEEGLQEVLKSRAYVVSSELGSVALALIQVPKGNQVEEFCSKIKATLFRTTDAVYGLPSRRQVALVLDDCKAEDGPWVIARIEKAVGSKFRYGLAHCPSDGLDPALLTEIADARLAEMTKAAVKTE